MATYYYNAAVDTDWNNDSNWWLDDAFTIPASGLPSNTDNAISVASIISNGPPESPGDTPTVANFTLNDLTEGLDPPYLGITINVTNTATFNGSASINAQGSIDGNAIFNNGAYNQGTVTGNATFNNAINYAAVGGDATFNGQFSFHAGLATVDGNATFNDNTSNGASVLGNATFNDAAFNQGTVTGNATFTAAVFGGEGNAPFNPVGTVSGTITFSNETPVSFTLGGTDIWNVDSSTWIFTTAGQSWTFNDTSYNSSIVNGDATFNSGTVPDTSYNAGTISNNATFNSISYNASGGVVSGNATFNNYTINKGGATVSGDAVFNDDSRNDIPDYPGGPAGLVSGNGTFNNNSKNYGNITGNAIFTSSLFDGSLVVGNVGGTITFSSETPVAFVIEDYIGGTYYWSLDTSSWIFTTAGQNWTFNDTAYNNSIINGDATFNDSSYNGSSGTISGDTIFNNSSYNDGSITGNPTFNNTSYNSGTVNGDATFNDTTYNTDTINGNPVFNNTSYNHSNGAITGNAIFNDDSYNDGSITGNVTFTKGSFTASPENGTVSGNVIFSPISSGSVSFTLSSSYEWTSNTSQWIFNDPPIFTFNDSSYNYGIITYPVIFNDSSFNDENGRVGPIEASLLLHFDGANSSTTFVDSSINAAAVTTNGNAQISTSQSQFGGSSGYFDGYSYISLNTSSNFNFSTDNFTIEGWINAIPGGYYGIAGSRGNGLTEGWCLYLHPDGTFYTGSVRGQSSYSDIQLHPTPIQSNTWTHFALVKNILGYKLYINGIAGPILSEGGFQYLPSAPIAIGALSSYGEYPFSGYIDELRIIKGVAVYNSNFTPPTAPLNATYVNAIDPSAFNDTVFNDSSYNRGTVNGNATFDSTLPDLYPSIPAYNDYTGVVTGNATFNGTTANRSGTPFGGSRMYGTINGNAIFNDRSINVGRVNGNATFNTTVIYNPMNNDYPANNSFYGQIGGNATFNGTSYNDGYTNTGGFGPPSSYGIVEGDATFNDESGNGGTVEGNATFNNSTANLVNATVSGNATFNGTSFNQGIQVFFPYTQSRFATVQGDATFNNTAYNLGIVEGLTTYSVSAAINMIVQEYTLGSHDGGVDIKYEKGINGSSILGLL